jgi:hypothetical protein
VKCKIQSKAQSKKRIEDTFFTRSCLWVAQSVAHSVAQSKNHIANLKASLKGSIKGSLKGSLKGLLKGSLKGSLKGPLKAKSFDNKVPFLAGCLHLGGKV